MANYVEVPVSVPVEADGKPLKLYVEARRGAGEQQISSKVPTNLDDVTATIRYVAGSVGSALADAAPDKFSVELGFELKAEAGGLVAILVNGSATATIKATLEWEPSAAKGS
jgi:hypothetical protein